MSQRKSRENILIDSDAGPAISFDDTGLVMTLSDRVLRDISLRQRDLSLSDGQGLPAAMARFLRDIDHWNPRMVGEWLHFGARLPGKQGAREFRKHAYGGDIVGSTHQPIWGVLGLGGARAALGVQRRATYPYHVLAPADEAGAVGHAGTDTAPMTADLQHLTEVTPDAILAEAILDQRMAAYDPLPLFFTRYECDSS
ncbi:MAG: hypothetical protein AAF826_12400, partial [Pseudomonadota bacterium]